MIGWFQRSVPMRGKLATAFAFLCLPLPVTCWIAAREVGRMEVVAASGSEAALQAALRSGGDLLFYFSFAALAVSLVLAVAFFRTIADPFAALLPQLEALAAGELTQPTPFTGQRDCAGRMARAIEACWEARTAADTDALAQRKRADEAERRLEEARLAAESERRVVMASLAQGLAALSATRGGVRAAKAPAPAPIRPVAVREPVLVVDNVTPPPMTVPARDEEPLHLTLVDATGLQDDSAGLRGLLTRLGGPGRRRAAW